MGDSSAPQVRCDRSGSVCMHGVVALTIGIGFASTTWRLSDSCCRGAGFIKVMGMLHSLLYFACVSSVLYDTGDRLWCRVIWCTPACLNVTYRYAHFASLVILVHPKSAKIQPKLFEILQNPFKISQNQYKNK